MQNFCIIRINPNKFLNPFINLDNFGFFCIVRCDKVKKFTQKALFPIRRHDCKLDIIFYFTSYGRTEQSTEIEILKMIITEHLLSLLPCQCCDNVFLYKTHVGHYFTTHISVLDVICKDSQHVCCCLLLAQKENREASTKPMIDIIFSLHRKELFKVQSL